MRWEIDAYKGGDREDHQEVPGCDTVCIDQSDRSCTVKQKAGERAR